jgi:hypothetical protein
MNYQPIQDPTVMDQNIGETGIWNRTIASDHHTPTPEPIMDEIKRIMPAGSPIADLGCGLGYTCRSLSESGFDVIGYEGTQDLNDLAVFAPILVQDLAVRFWMPIQKNIICLEVGEHIPRQFEEIVFDNITNNAKWRVILSWAIPDQGGTGHYNERPNYHIIAQMQRRGFMINSELTDQLRSVTPDLTWWFRKSIMVFDRT